MLKKYLLNTLTLFLLLTPYHAYAQFGDFLKKAVKEVETAVKEVETAVEEIGGVSDELRIEKSEKSGKEPGSQGGRAFKSDRWLATLHASRIEPRIQYGNLDDEIGCRIDVSDIYEILHRERRYARPYNNKFIGIFECGRSGDRKSISFDRIQKWFDNKVSGSAMIFETSIEFERKTNNWTNDQTIQEYRRRLSTVWEMVDEQYDGKLNMWRDRSFVVNELSWRSDASKVLQRLTWMCDNIFDDIAINQAGNVSLVLGVTSEQLCGPLLDSFDGTKVGELAERLAATVSLDPEKMTSSGLLIAPSNFAYLYFVLGYRHMEHDIPNDWLGRTDGEWFLPGVVSQSMAMLSANVMFTAWYGFEPPTPFTFYRDQIQDAAKEFLLRDIKNLADIDRRAQQTNLDDDDFTFLLSTIDEQSLDQKSNRILSVYKDKFGEYTSLAEQQNELASQKIEEQKRKDYLEAYILFATVEACFTARREYLVKYITREQFSATKTKWTDLRSSFDLSDSVKSSVEAEIEERDSYRLFMTSVSLAQYTDAMAQDCRMALTALNLR